MASRPDKRKTFWDKSIKDKDGRVVLAQRPNLPILVWAATTVLAYEARGTLGHTLRLIALGALLLWSLLEIFQGVNYFRRALGILVLAMIIIS